MYFLSNKDSIQFNSIQFVWWGLSEGVLSGGGLSEGVLSGGVYLREFCPGGVYLREFCLVGFI